MEVSSVERARQATAFQTLLTGIFINSPLIDNQHLVGISETQIIQQYGLRFQQSLSTFSQLSSAEQIYLVHHLQW